MSTSTSPGSGGPEYIGSGEPAAARSGSPTSKRLSVVGVAAAGVVGVVALGGWGAYALLAGGGTQPAEVVPAAALAYASLDLDPAAAQKIEAVKILKKFPAIDEQLDISAQDDLRELFFREAFEASGCEDLNYDRDVKPWIGDRVAVAALPGAGEEDPTPLVALQVTDQDKAAAGIGALATCLDLGDDFGHALLHGYLLLSDSTSHAEAAAADAAEHALADEPQFRRWTDEVGDPGIVTVFAAAQAPAVLQDRQDVYSDFEGAAGVLRFDDGAVELEWAGKGMPAGVSALGGGATGSSVADLPADTGAAISVALADGWLDRVLENLGAALGGRADIDQRLEQLERQSGLQLPEDVEALLGDRVSIAVDAEGDFQNVIETEDISALSAGLKVSGDPDEIMAAVEKIRDRLGPDADAFVVEAGEDAVAFGADPAYVRSLLEDSGLGDEEAFKRVVPGADRAGSVLFVSFDAGDGWAETLADLVGQDPAAAKNIAPLDALGVSVWTDPDDVDRGLLRLTTD